MLSQSAELRKREAELQEAKAELQQARETSSGSWGFWTPQVGLSAIDEFIESEFFKSGAWKKKPSPPAGEPEPEPPRKRKPRAPPRATKPKRQEEPSEPAPRMKSELTFTTR
eukprot:jgi/Tetstr1/455776/TSEL_042573.t1